MSGYDTGLVCAAGHAINGCAQSAPAHNQAFCDRCGEKAIGACEHCRASIRGKFLAPRVVDLTPYEPPGYCYNCGSAFPWTLRRLAAAATLARESGDLSEAEASEFEKGLSEVVRDTPEGQVAASRLKRLLAKLGKGTAGMVRDLVVEVASEAAKKVLFP